MEEVGILRPWRIRTIQANDAEILIFDPETTQKTAFAGILLRGYIEHQAAHVAQKLAVDVCEIVMLAVEIIAIGKNHPRESHRLVLHLEQLGEATEQMLLHALVLEIVCPIH